jgi:hypothetical protein
VIIKTKRVRTRGGGLKRLLDHLLTGDENEEIKILRGTVADLTDAVADARKIGSEYALRHFIVAPSRELTDKQFLLSAGLLGSEYKFNPADTFIVRHQKAHVDPALFDGHVHILVREVDPTAVATGARKKILSSSNSYARNEKLSRIMEFEWGHPYTRPAHLIAVLAALRREGRDDIAAALEHAFPDETTRPREAFSSADQQRLKREGYDLPALRLIVSEAWTTKTNRSDFTARLADHSLTVRQGDKPETYVVETADGVFIGALHRLVRLRKEAVVKRMEELDARQDQAYDCGSNLSQYSVNPEAAPTDNGRRGTRPEPDRGERSRNAPEGPPSGVGGDPTTAGWAGENHHASDPAEHREGRERHVERVGAGEKLRFGLTLDQHRPKLHELLALANSMARPPNERLAIELGAVEEKARHATAMANMPIPEPKFLLDARTEAREAARKVDDLQQRVDQIASSISALSNSTSWWRRAIDWVTGARLHRQSQIAGLRATQKKAELAVKQAEQIQLRMDRNVVAAEAQHREAARAHFEKWNQEAAYTEQRLATIKAAEQFWQSMPGASYLGFDAVYAVGRRIAAFQNREAHGHTRSRGRGGIPIPHPH